MAFNKKWMKIIDRTAREYREGVDSFLNVAFPNIAEGDDTTTIRCPCDKFCNQSLENSVMRGLMC
ncbi:Carbamoyl-phosphate synthase large chain [Bienertia sinuspersici]